MTALIFDTETTGLINHPLAKDETQPRVIEWGGCLVDGSGAILDEANILIHPGCPLPEKIVKITGITDEDLKDAPRFHDAVDQIRSFFARADTLVAHNLPFDYGMMELELKRVRQLDGWPWPALKICTVQEHAEEFGHRPKLTELYQYYMGKPLAQTHRALDDVHALVEVCVASGVLND